MISLTRKEISNIILHVICVATFIAIFFFTYTAKVEGQIVENQVKIILNNLFENATLLNDETKEFIRNKLNEMEAPDMSVEDEKVKKQNNGVMLYAAKIIFGFVIISFIVSYYMFNSDTDPNKGSYVDLLKENAILIVFVAVTEYAFLHLVTKNYIFGDSNFVKKQILLSLKKYSVDN